MKECWDIPKYRRKRESNTSKASRKTNHKHEYNLVIVESANGNFWKPANRCTICGRIKELSFNEMLTLYRNHKNHDSNSAFGLFWLGCSTKDEAIQAFPEADIIKEKET